MNEIYQAQWGKAQKIDGSYKSTSTFSIKFLNVFCGVGTLIENSNSSNNYDDCIKFTVSTISFNHHGHYWIALGS